MKKILSIALVVVLLCGMAVSGTMAYLTDTASDVNVMTLGNVKIEQHEYQRAENADGTFKTDTIDNVTSYVLEGFEQAKPLLPVTEDLSLTYWDPTAVRMSQVDSYGGVQVFNTLNAQDKIVTVENTGKTDAYVRTIVAFEKGSTTQERFSELLGVNMRVTDNKSDYSQPWLRNIVGDVEIDGNKYRVYEFVYHGANIGSGEMRHANGILPAGDTTYPSLAQVYLNSKATNEDVEALDGNKNGMYDILVLSQAVQAEGFANAATALTAGFGAADDANVAAWFEGSEAKVPVVVEDADALKKAIDDGEKDILVNGAELTEKIPLKSDVNATFVDCTITGNNAWGYVNNATFQNCTFDSGSANAAIHFDELHGDLVVNDCTFKSGKVQIGNGGDATAVFSNCTFAATTQTHSIWTEMGIRIYCPVVFNNCEFNNRVVMAGSPGQPVTFNSCTMNGGTPVYYVDNADGIIRGGNIPKVVIDNVAVN